MPGSLEFLRPTSVAEAVAMLEERGEAATVIAGSTAVTIMLRERLIDPDALVSLAGLTDDGISDIRLVDGRLRLGALVTHRQVERHATVREAIPLVADVFSKVANVRVRNQATVGGVVAEADYASDPPAVLCALDAEIEAVGPDGSRMIPTADFFVAFYETALRPSELVTAVHVPVPPEGSHGVYEKFVTRSSEDRPCVGVAAVVQRGPDGQDVEDVRVAVGAATETPQRFRDLEQELIETGLSDDAVRRFAEAFSERVDPLDDLRGSAWYRREMVKVWVRRAIEHASGSAEEASREPAD